MYYTIYYLCRVCPLSGAHAVTMSGNQIDDVHVTTLTFSELLRLYLVDRCENDMGNVRKTFEVN